MAVEFGFPDAPVVFVAPVGQKRKEVVAVGPEFAAELGGAGRKPRRIQAAAKIVELRLFEMDGERSHGGDSSKGTEIGEAVRNF